MARQIITYIMLFASLNSLGIKQLLPVERTPFECDELSVVLWDASKHSVLDETSGNYVSLLSNGLIRERLCDITNLFLVAGDTIYFRGITKGREIGLLTDSFAVVSLSGSNSNQSNCLECVYF